MKILDCTLRDGGYYTNWDFEQSTVETYIEAFNHLPVDYLEIGYRSNPMNDYLGEFFYLPEYVLKNIKELSTKKLAIILNEKDVKANETEALLSSCKPYLDMVRIAVSPDDFERALKLGEAVKNMGFEVCFNVMYMSEWENKPELMSLIPSVDGIVDYFYMVDSFGGVFPNDVKKTMDMIRSKTSVKLGFHGHNNLEMGLSNTLTAIEQGVDIVDATVTGMGRGAGNLKTELLLTVLNAQGKVDFEYNWLSKVTDVFSDLQRNYEWGTNLPYMVSGANSIPQKNVMEWVSKRYYSFNSIIRALNNESRGLDDNEQLLEMKFNNSKKYSAALIVGGGLNVIKHNNAIQVFLAKHPEIVVIHASSRNAMCFNEIVNDQYFCLVGNEGYRLENVFGDASKANGVCILPPFPRKMGTYIPSKLKKRAFELKAVNFTDKLKDTHTSLAIETAIELSVNKLYLVGYDGYTEKSMSNKEQELYIENEYLFAKAKEAGLDLVTLTSSSYTLPKQDSVFSQIR